MKDNSFIFTMTFLLILIWSSQGYPLKEDTHRAINEYVAKNSVRGFSLTDYLINNLGFKKGDKEFLTGDNAEGGTVYKEIFWWLGYGGEQEDRPGSNWDYIWNNPTRSVNHFHNPLKTNWDEAGLNDTVLGRTFTGQSSVLWTQNTNQALGGNWSWQDVREYFYIALTGRDFTGNNVTPLPGETEKEKRERYFTYTFRGVGQQMHLVEDASVNHEVRNG